MALRFDTIDAAKMPVINKTAPRQIAPDKEALPLGRGRSGRSTASNSASQTSLKTTPPP